MMDTSEEYVKMCRAAKEIQEVWKKENGDFFSEDDNNVSTIGDYELDMNVIGYGTYPKNFEWLEGKFVWLPRQDQLQEIGMKAYEPCDIWRAWRLFNHFIQFKISFTPDSFESAWLSWCMWAICNKKWNGEEWVTA